MIEQDLPFYIIVTIFLLAMLLATIAIPIMGFSIKRFKGLFLGCLVQSFVGVVLFFLTVFGIVYYQRQDLRKRRDAAMVTVRKTVEEEEDEFTYTWYLKADEECLYERSQPDRSQSIIDQRENAKLFDVVYVDSTTVEVDDRVVVKFDLKEHSVTATDFGEPIEVVNVDWERVSKYFQGRP